MIFQIHFKSLHVADTASPAVGVTVPISHVTHGGRRSLPQVSQRVKQWEGGGNGEALPRMLHQWSCSLEQI